MLTLIDNFLSKAEIAEFRAALDAADWADGKASAGALASNAKRNHQLPETSDTAIKLGEQILRKLGSHPLLVSAALPEKIYPPKFNRYGAGEYYDVHVDSPVMRARGVTIRTDLSCTLFLTEPEDYEGGVLTIETDFGAQEIKLGAGDLVLYPSRSLHHVTPVTNGVRTSSFFWIQSMVGDDAKRSILFDLDQSVQALTAAAAPQDEIMRLSAVYNNLLRRWAAV